jgi:hypothetical protein
MSVLKYKDPVTGEVKKVGSPNDFYTKAQVDMKIDEIKSSAETWTFTLDDGSTVTKVVYVG